MSVDSVVKYVSSESVTKLISVYFITFRVRHSRGEMYVSHGRLCVCLSVPHRIPTLLHGPGCDLGEW